MVESYPDVQMDLLDSIRASTVLSVVYPAISSLSDLKLLTLLDFLRSGLVNLVDAAMLHVSSHYDSTVTALTDSRVRKRFYSYYLSRSHVARSECPGG